MKKVICRLFLSTFCFLLQLVNQYDIVVNCSGLGSKYLLPDETVYPVKGQLIQVSEAG